MRRDELSLRCLHRFCGRCFGRHGRAWSGFLRCHFFARCFGGRQVQKVLNGFAVLRCHRLELDEQALALFGLTPCSFGLRILDELAKCLYRFNPGEINAVHADILLRAYGFEALTALPESYLVYDFAGEFVIQKLYIYRIGSI